MASTSDDAGGLSRRDALAAAGAAGIGLALAGIGCGNRSRDAGAPRSASADMCPLTPEQTEGPYYLADSMVRRDITEGREGLPLDLRLTVREARSCEPIAGATVEVWHCDAHGAYSGFNSAGTFLRGGQRCDDAGRVRFDTIYPGWYPGRTTHIHVKVFAGGDHVHTGQLYFDDALTRAVYERPPYSSRGQPVTTNARDGIYSDGGRRSTLRLSARGDGYRGEITLGVRV